jgi:hypothetical protein
MKMQYIVPVFDLVLVKRENLQNPTEEEEDIIREGNTPFWLNVKIIILYFKFFFLLIFSF